MNRLKLLGSIPGPFFLFGYFSLFIVSFIVADLTGRDTSKSYLLNRPDLHTTSFQLWHQESIQIRRTESDLRIIALPSKKSILSPIRQVVDDTVRKETAFSKLMHPPDFKEQFNTPTATSTNRSETLLHPIQSKNFLQPDPLKFRPQDISPALAPAIFGGSPLTGIAAFESLQQILIDMPDFRSGYF